MYTQKIIFTFCFYLFLCTSCKQKTNSRAETPTDIIGSETKANQSADNNNLKLLKCGLWIDSNGDIIYKTIAAVAPKNGEDIPQNIEDYYIYTVQNELDSINNYKTKLRDIVDTTTFQLVGDCSYKDKKHVYIFVPMAYGGHLYVDYGIDIETFRSLGNSGYTRDKDHCFYAGKKIANADVETFVDLERKGVPIAKDKNNYYQWDDIMTNEDIAEYEKENKIDIRKL